MAYRILADATVVLHFAFLLFAVFGGLLVGWRPWVAWLHLPAASWGVCVEFTGWVCPLTPLENWLRERGGGPTYTAPFVEHHILPILYPAGSPSSCSGFWVAWRSSSTPRCTSWCSVVAPGDS